VDPARYARARGTAPALRVTAMLAAGVLGWLDTAAPPDLISFGALGQSILAGRLGEVYDAAWNQAGPVQLLASRLLVIGAQLGRPARPATALIDAGLVLAAMALCARLTADRGAALARREAVAAVLALVWLAAPAPWNGHPAELAIPAGWAYAIVLLRRGRAGPAAAVLALTAAIAPWAALGFGCLLAAAPPRRALRTGALAAALGTAAYLPFVATGHFAMFTLHWPVADGSLVHLLAPGRHELTWWLRLVQGAVVAGGCAFVAWRFRDRRVVLALAPLTATLLRVATDPLDMSYYWFPAAVATLLLLALVPATETPAVRALAAGLGYLTLLAEAARWTVAGPFACLAVMAVLLAVTRPDPRLPVPGRTAQPALTGSGSTRAVSKRR
jgi:hypothetical protein